MKKLKERNFQVNNWIHLKSQEHLLFPLMNITLIINGR